MVTRLPKATALGPLPQQDSVWRQQNVTCWHCVCAALCVRALLVPHGAGTFQTEKLSPQKERRRAARAVG